MIVVITSPDNLSINMFSSFLQETRMSSALIVNLNGLLSSDVLEGIATQSIESTSKDIIFRHKTRRKFLPAKIPSFLTEKADCIIGFDLYGMHARVVKSFPGWTENLIQEWDSFVSRLEFGKASNQEVG